MKKTWEVETEAEIEKRLREKIKEVLHGRAFKWVSPGNRGVPDRIVLLPGGRVVFVELKAPGKKPTAVQSAMHAVLFGLGFRVQVIDSKECVDRFIARQLDIQLALKAREFSE